MRSPMSIQFPSIPRFTTVAACLVLVFLAVPLLILAVQSFTAESYLSFPPTSFGLRWYRFLYESQDWRAAALRSLGVAGIVAPVALAMGTLAAIGLHRGPRPGRKAIYSFLIAPMVLPHLVLALGMMRIALVAGVEDTILGLVAAHLTVALPYVVIMVGASLEATDPTQEEAARSLGADVWRVFRHITLPSIRPGLLAGLIFAFIASFDEFILTYFLATFQNTLPLQIYGTLSFQVEPSIAAASTIALIGTAFLTALVLTRGQIVSGGKIVR